MEWPWRRFERFYEAYMKRRLVETLERRKEGMITALWSNSNYDDDKGTRKQIVEDIEEEFKQMVLMVQTGIKPEDEIDQDNPFFAAAREGVKKLEAPRNDEGTVREVIDYSKGIDQ